LKTETEIRKRLESKEYLENTSKTTQGWCEALRWVLN